MKHWKPEERFEALENQAELQKKAEEPECKDSLLEDETGSSSSDLSESDGPVQAEKKKSKLPKKIRKRVDKYKRN